MTGKKNKAFYFPKSYKFDCDTCKREGSASQLKKDGSQHTTCIYCLSNTLSMKDKTSKKE